MKDPGTDIAERVEEISRFQTEAKAKLRDLDVELGEWFAAICDANILLGEKLKSRNARAARTQVAAPAAPVVPVVPAAPLAPAAPVTVGQNQPTGEDYKASIEKLLQGSIDALGDKLSDKILGMLKDLRTMSGPVREAKMSEIWSTAQSEHVDLAGMFLHEKVESNLGSEGLKIEEKKTQGIGSILDKLKKMKGGT